MSLETPITTSMKLRHGANLVSTRGMWLHQRTIIRHVYSLRKEKYSNEPDPHDAPQGLSFGASFPKPIHSRQVRREFIQSQYLPEALGTS